MRTRLLRSLLAAIGGLVLLGGVATTTTASPPGRAAPPSVTLTESALEGVHGTAPDATVRNVLTVTAAGTRLRVRLSNPFGGTPVDVRSVWIGLQPSPNSPALVPGSDQRATFAGARTIRLAPGTSAWTDAVSLSVRPGDHVSVSVYAPGAPIDDHTFPPPQTDTPGSFLSTAPVDTGADESGTAFGAFRPGTLWWVDAVRAVSPSRGTIVTLGDSITDGYHADGPPGSAGPTCWPTGSTPCRAGSGSPSRTPASPATRSAPAQPVRPDRPVLRPARTAAPRPRRAVGAGRAHGPAARGHQRHRRRRQCAVRPGRPGDRRDARRSPPGCTRRHAAHRRRHHPADVQRPGQRQGADPPRGERLDPHHRHVFDAVLDFDAVLRDPADPT